jgi:hypothetical protein
MDLTIKPLGVEYLKDFIALGKSVGKFAGKDVSPDEFMQYFSDNESDRITKLLLATLKTSPELKDVYKLNEDDIHRVALLFFEELAMAMFEVNKLARAVAVPGDLNVRGAVEQT